MSSSLARRLALGLAILGTTGLGALAGPAQADGGTYIKEYKWDNMTCTVYYNSSGAMYYYSCRDRVY